MATRKDLLIEPFDSKNLVPLIDEDTLKEIGTQVIEDYKMDKGSRTDWNNKRKNWLRLFMQDMGPEKAFPWQGAANIPVPILTTAVIQFQARAYEALMPAKGKIKVARTGLEDQLRADRVEKHMNFQIDYQMDEFEEGWDVSLFQLPINGSIFRKTYRDPLKGRNVSDYISVEDVIIDYTSDPTRVPRRISQILDMTPNDIALRAELGIFERVDKLERTNVVKGKTVKEIPAGSAEAIETAKNEIRPAADRLDSQNRSSEDKETPRILIEQHGWYDLSTSGRELQEPYVITVDLETEEVLRITKRKTLTGEVVDYFTHYYFFPNPEGYYGLGFGHILEGINEAASSVLNQIVDAGTLANLSGKTGFVNSRSQIKKGDFQLSLGDYKSIPASSDDIRKSIYHFEFPGPNVVLFQVLGLLQEYATRVTTVSETMTGELPSSDTTATAMVAAIEQGMKVMSVIHKRTHRTFKKEIRKMYILNGVYTRQEEYLAILGDHTVSQHAQAREGQPPVALEDYSGFIDIQPISDPNITSRSEKTAIAEQVKLAIMENPFTSQNEEAVRLAYMDFFSAMGVEDGEKFWPPPPPPPDLPQEEENAMMLREEEIHALPHQDHIEHVRIMADFEESPFFDQMTPRGKNLWKIHEMEHISYQYLVEVSQEQENEQLEAIGQQLEEQGLA